MMGNFGSGSTQHCVIDFCSTLLVEDLECDRVIHYVIEIEISHGVDHVMSDIYFFNVF